MSKSNYTEFRMSQSYYNGFIFVKNIKKIITALFSFFFLPFEEKKNKAHNLLNFSNYSAPIVLNQVSQFQKLGKQNVLLTLKIP